MNYILCTFLEKTYSIRSSKKNPQNFYMVQQILYRLLDLCTFRFIYYAQGNSIPPLAVERIRGNKIPANKMLLISQLHLRNPCDPSFYFLISLLNKLNKAPPPQ